MVVVVRFLRAVAELIRSGEPYAYEDDDDLMVAAGPGSPHSGAAWA